MGLGEGRDTSEVLHGQSAEPEGWGGVSAGGGGADEGVKGGMQTRVILRALQRNGAESWCSWAARHEVCNPRPGGVHTMRPQRKRVPEGAAVVFD